MMNPDNNCDEFIAVFTDRCCQRDVAKLFNGFYSRIIRNLENELLTYKAHVLIGGESAIELDLELNMNYYQTKIIYRWISQRVGANIPRGCIFTQFELKDCAKKVLCVNM